MQINQIFISDQPNNELPPYIRHATATVKACVPHSEHKIWSNDELREWIFSNYGEEMVGAYDKLVPYAYKADLARYLLLYLIGGWYFDITIRVVNSITVGEDIDFITFLDLPQYTNVTYACNNGIIFSKKYSPILEDAINATYSNIKDSFYGKSPLSITGPVLFGNSVAKFEKDLNIVSGTFMDLTPGFLNKNRGFVFNDGTLLALHKDGNKGGDLEYLGILGTNNYGRLYIEKNVFLNDIHLPEYLVKNKINLT